MPSINRIRVNNVKYNFGTQFYDDFTMRMYGKNTLYDLANGGGKSVLMLLLLQNMIPNCTLDDKQPIEKLFRTGNGNTTIHSLVEWKLEEAERTEGYRYMTTGFCARKAKDAAESESDTKEVASIEYFNYCIFYREFNKNDIVNLPLAKDGERISFQGLRTYLKDLEHRDMNLKVMVFDRKGEYQRFISGYGLHESQWEIIRGINKTEGHVRTYFENNYKTTRKVVEDLLIEEIIEKAYMVKTERDEDGSDSMARMLMDIKEQLTILAKKKKDIGAYDHQMELIQVLADKVGSFLDLYKEQSKLTKLLADIYVTGAEYAKHGEERLAELEKARDEKHEQKTNQRRYMECLKVARDKYRVSDLASQGESLLKQQRELEQRLKDLCADLSMKESMNDYLEYMKDFEQYNHNDLLIRNLLSESEFDEDALYTYAYNIKLHLDVMLANLRGQIAEIEEKIIHTEAEKKYREKLLKETEITLAIVRDQKRHAEEEITELSGRLSEIRMSMHQIQFAQLADQKNELVDRLADQEKEIKDKTEIFDEERQSISKKRLELDACEQKQASNRLLLDELSKKQERYKIASETLNNIKQVYGENDLAKLKDAIANRITNAIIEIEKLNRDIAKAKQKITRLSEGRLIDISEAAEKVMNYIETRHGVQAMFGMDYLSALPVEQREKILNSNPELPYGVLVKDYAVVEDDPNLRMLDTGANYVCIYDMDAIENRAIMFGENAFSVCRDAKTLADAELASKLQADVELAKKEAENTLEVKKEVLATYREDQAFVLQLSDDEYVLASERYEAALAVKKELEESHENLSQEIHELELKVDKDEKELKELRRSYEEGVYDVNKLQTMEELTKLVAKQEEIVESSVADIDRLEEKMQELRGMTQDDNRDTEEQQALIKTLEQKVYSLEINWDNTYRPYYNVDGSYETLSLSDEELKAKFTAMLSSGTETLKAVEDKRSLMEALKTSMEKSKKNIEKRGISIKKLDDYAARGLLYYSDEIVLNDCQNVIEDTKEQKLKIEKKYRDKESEKNRLEGSISYAIANIEAAYGSYQEELAGPSEIISNLENGEKLLVRLASEAKECEEACKAFAREQGDMLELYKDVKRIVTTHDLDVSNAVPKTEGKEELRSMFEDALLRFDRSTKQLDRAKNELLKFKGNTATALDSMSAFELANSIREDVVIPVDYEEANHLAESLASMVSYIELERDRVEKSLTDMETMKQNFETQCLQRCLDVRTELDKLPKLSRIMMDGEAIQMVGLNIPYVKDEFLKQRMSDYVDRIVAQADDYSNDKDRMKFIRSSLTLKRLFNVIVTDMNAIKLSLYKRERIKEQSRYLKYEEAVGSTGQSQGIYIQFLVSIINYISGMYQTGNEDVRTKTIFIDNPFGAAKDVYIWEPIFALLAANHVQLIVPARGATPAITGRFDVNYILGQQMTGGRQLTVVADYTSRVDQAELEYQDLEYEQVSFDFI